MNWQYKAILQFIFSQIPFGENMNYFCQRFITKSLPINDQLFIKNVQLAKKHLVLIEKYIKRELEKTTFFEFGAGWDLVIPLSYYLLGVKHQILIDIRHLLRQKLVNYSINKFRYIAKELELNKLPNHVLNRNFNFLTSLKKYYGIDYRAPCDARSTGFSDSSIDVITSTNTLEHISKKDIQSILIECHRILKDDGLMSIIIDYQDHYAYFDNTITVYNFLKYSDKTWRFLSPTLHYQNRMRHRDYIDIFRAVNFRIISCHCRYGTKVDHDTIKYLSINKRFNNYSFEELSVRSAHILLCKK